MTLAQQTAILGITTLTTIASSYGQAANDRLTEGNPSSDLSSLFAQLGSDRFQLRQKAQQEILQAAAKDKERILNRSLDAYLDAADPEVRYRLRATMYGIISGNLRPEGFIGIRMMDAPMRIINGGKVENIRAVQILSVVDKTAASKAGLLRGDRITHLDGKSFKFQSPAYVELSKYIRSKNSGETVTLSITRGQAINNMKKMEVKIKLGSRPEGLDTDRKARAFTEWFKESLKERGLGNDNNETVNESQPGTTTPTGPTP